MVLPASNRVSRVPLYSGTTHGPLDFVYGAITLFGRPSQAVRLSAWCPLLPLPGDWIALQHDTYNAGRLAYVPFGLFRVRSPLLAESLI